MFFIRNFNYEKMEVIIFSSLGDLTKPFFLIMGEFIVKKYFFSFQKFKINLYD